MPMSSHSYPSSNHLITRTHPNAVTYDLTSPYHTTITLPAGSTWTSGLHWHERHVEFLRVVKGAVRVQLDGAVKVIAARGTAEPGQQEEEEEAVVWVKRGVRHEWGRADCGMSGNGEGEGEEVVVVESTEPEDGEKSAFFWCLNRIILGAQAEARARESEAQDGKSWIGVCRARFWEFVADMWTTLQLLIVFGKFDNFPVFWHVSGRPVAIGWSRTRNTDKFMEWIVTHLVLNVAAIVGWVAGIEVITKEDSPPDVSTRSISKKEQ